MTSCQKPNVIWTKWHDTNTNCRPCKPNHYTLKPSGGTTTNGTDGDCRSICKNCDKITPSFCANNFSGLQDANINEINECCKGQFPFIKPNDENKDMYRLDNECYLNLKSNLADQRYNTFLMNYSDVLFATKVNIDKEECEKKKYTWCTEIDNDDACAGYNDIDGARCMHMKYNDPNYFLRDSDRKRMGRDLKTLTDGLGETMGRVFAGVGRVFGVGGMRFD